MPWASSPADPPRPQGTIVNSKYASLSWPSQVVCFCFVSFFCPELASPASVLPILPSLVPYLADSSLPSRPLCSRTFAPGISVSDPVYTCYNSY